MLAANSVTVPPAPPSSLATKTSGPMLVIARGSASANPGELTVRTSLPVVASSSVTSLLPVSATKRSAPSSVMAEAPSIPSRLPPTTLTS